MDKISIPKGSIKTLEELLPKFDFIFNRTLRRNICYAVQALNFYSWVLKSVKIYGPVESYLYKTGIILINMIVECMTQDFLKSNQIQLAKKHSKNIKKLPPLGISQKLINKMESLNKRRSNIHLHLVTDLEAGKYTSQDWKFSVKCCKEVMKKFETLKTRK